jgi:hypothetical protein
MAERGRNGRRRARRFPITTALQYRERGTRRWQRGRTVNVSRTGVLFQPDDPLPLSARALDFVVSLPLGGGLPPPRVRCVGRIVRRAFAGFGGALSEVAVAIDGWALEGRPLH